MTTDEQLKSLDKKQLRLLIKDLISQRDDLLNKMGVLTSERDNLIESNKLQKSGLEKIAKDFKFQQDKNEILEANNKRISEELLLAQANKSFSAIMQGWTSDIKNKWHKVFKKS